MRERPILFSGPMVRAILDGRKTVTRRVLKGAWQAALEGHDHVKTWFAPPDVPAEGIPNQWAQSGIWAEKWGPRGYNRWLGFSPFRPADRLWVRETWKPHSLYAGMRPRDVPETPIFYRADDRYAPSNTPWKPGIHMPRWASRITLEVTSVKVERLQDISEEDAAAEGAVLRPDGWWAFVDERKGLTGSATSARAWFAMVWNSINGPGSWEANPWVVAISFRVVAPDQASPGGCGEGTPSACAGGPSP